MFGFQYAYAFKSTVPGEGGYGTIEYDTIVVTGTFHREFKWCRDCVYISKTDNVRVEGNFVRENITKNGWDLVPVDNEAIMYDEARSLKFSGRFDVKYGDSWDFGSGIIEYKGKKYSSNTYGFWEAGEEVIQKYNEELIAENNLKNAAKVIQTMGPSFLIIKKGEHGALLFNENKIFECPSFLVNKGMWDN